jgi:hypothetical protein
MRTALIELPRTVRPISDVATRAGLPCRWRARRSGAVSFLVRRGRGLERAGRLCTVQLDDGGQAVWLTSQSGKALTSPPAVFPWSKRPSTAAGGSPQHPRRTASSRLRMNGRAARRQRHLAGHLAVPIRPGRHPLAAPGRPSRPGRQPDGAQRAGPRCRWFTLASAGAARARQTYERIMEGGR